MSTLQRLTEKYVSEFLKDRGINQGSELVTSRTLFQEFRTYLEERNCSLPLHDQGFGRAVSKALPSVKRPNGTNYLIQRAKV